MSADDSLKPPKPTRADALYALVKAGISAIPQMGGPASELLALVIAPPLKKRQVDWMNRVAECLSELESKVDGFNMEKLRDNPLFVTVILHATTVALRNHQEEKLQALQNAVLNTARGIDLEENLQILFLELVDSFTPMHLKVLAYFDSPSNWLKDRGINLSVYVGGAGVGLEAGIPELKDRREIYDPIVHDLFNRGLLNTDRSGLHAMMTDSGIVAQRTTDLGKKFLRYISL